MGGGRDTSTGMMMGSCGRQRRQRRQSTRFPSSPASQSARSRSAREMRGDPLVFSVLQLSSAAGGPEQAYCLGQAEAWEWPLSTVQSEQSGCRNRHVEQVRPPWLLLLHQGSLLVPFAWLAIHRCQVPGVRPGLEARLMPLKIGQIETRLSAPKAAPDGTAGVSAVDVYRGWHLRPSPAAKNYGNDFPICNLQPIIHAHCFGPKAPRSGH